MADINIFVTDRDTQNNKVRYSGNCLVSPNFGAYVWEYEADFGDIAVDINNGIKAAAIAAAVAAGKNIGLLDKKTMVGGASDV